MLGPPESAHWRSAYAASPGRVIGIGTPNDLPPSSDGATNMLWFAWADARLWKSRYTRRLFVPGTGPSASHWRSWSASVFEPVDCCQVLPRSSVTAPGKLMPAVSSSLAITRPVGVVMMSTSGVLWVCPAKSSGVLCQVLPPSVENRTIAGAVFSSPPAPSDVEAPSPLVTTHSVPSGPVVIRGSVH